MKWFSLLALSAVVILIGEPVNSADPPAVRKESIEKLIAKLGSLKFAEREQAMKDIVAQGPVALEPLRKAIKNPDLEIARRAQDCIPIIERNVQIAALITALRDRNGETRAKAADDLMAFGPDGAAAVPALIATLDDPAARVRFRATVALGLVGPSAKPAVVKLIAVLQDQNEDEERRWAAAIALGRIGTAAEDAVPVLLKILENDKPMLRNGAAIALGGTGGSAVKVVPVLIKALNDKELNVQRNAATSLGLIGKEPEATVVALINALIKHKGFQGSDDPRPAMVGALAKFGSHAKGALPHFLDIAKEQGANEWVRTVAIRCVKETGPDARLAVPVLAELLRTGIIAKESSLGQEAVKTIEAIHRAFGN